MFEKLESTHLSDTDAGVLNRHSSDVIFRTVNWLRRNGINRPVTALSVARMADAIGNSILFVLLPLFVAKIPTEYIHLPLSVLVGVLISVYGFVSSAVQPVVGAVSDKFGHRKAIIQIGLISFGLTTLGFLKADNFLELLILRSIQGVSVALTIPAALSIMTSITRKESRGGSMGMYSMCRMIGFALGPLISGYLHVHYGFETAFYAGAGFIGIAMVLVHFWVKDPKDRGQEKDQPKFVFFDRSLLSPGILSAALATFLMANSFSIMAALENEFNARLNMNAFGFGLAFSMLMIARLPLQLPIGRLSDFIGRKPFVIGGLILMAPSTGLLGSVQSDTQLIVLRIIQGIATASIAAPAFAIAGDLSKKGGEGRQVSLLTTGFGLGIAVGPLMAGTLAVYDLALPFILSGFLCLIGAGIAYRYMPETVDRMAPLPK